MYVQKGFLLTLFAIMTVASGLYTVYQSMFKTDVKNWKEAINTLFFFFAGYAACMFGSHFL